MHQGKKWIAGILAAGIFFSAVPMGALAAPVREASVQAGALRIAVMSDTHLYPAGYIPADAETNQEWNDFCVKEGKQFKESEALVDTALATFAKDAKAGKLDCLIIPGDLTKDGELEGHKALAAKLAQFEVEAGIPVYVINGNHDINNTNACDYSSGTRQAAPKTSPEQFRQIYGAAGYSENDAAGTDYTAYVPPAGKQAGMLSYAVTLGNYRLIAMDTGKYSADSTKSGKAEHETGGSISTDLMAWVLTQIQQAKQDGLTPVGFCHHNLAPHFKYEELVLQDFTIDNWETVATTLANAGMHFVFTGHNHANDIASYVTDDGETLYDCETASLASFPNTIREVTLSTDTQGHVSAAYQTFDVDRDFQVTVDGQPIEKPYAKHSFRLSNSGNDRTDGDAAVKFQTLLKGYAGGFLEGLDIKQALAGFGLDIDALLAQYIGDGYFVSLGSVGVTLTPKLVSAVVDDLIRQIQTRYIDRWETALLPYVNDLIDQLAGLRLSDLTNSRFAGKVTAANPYGLELRSAAYGTLGDVILTAMHDMAAGNEDAQANDPLVMDVLAQLQSADTARLVLDVLLGVVVDDLLIGDLLQNLTLNLDVAETAAPEMSMIISVLGSVLGGRNVPLNKVTDMVLSGGVKGFIQGYIDDYLTDSQLQSVGMLLADALRSLTIDANPTAAPNQDGDANGVTYTYRGKVAVEPTMERYQLPSNVVVTFGADTVSQRNISWYTKAGIVGSDIEIVPYSDAPRFTGEAALPSGVTAKVHTELSGVKVRTYPGLDFGVFGLFEVKKEMYRHVLAVDGLQAGQKYAYRVGDAARGWWSEPGVLEGGMRSGAFTFFHMTDSQAQNAEQYQKWGDTVTAAFAAYPDAKFIVHTGDVVDAGGNANQWQWALNASDKIHDTVIMAAAGNHEASGDYATVDNFALTGLPQQDTATGAYYAFEYSNAMIAVLNTNDLSAQGLSAEQTRWLTSVMQASNRQWKIVALHKAPYSNGSHIDDSDVTALRKQFQTLMPELGIDLVLEGHDHVYMRTPMLKENQVTGQAEPVTAGGIQYETSAKGAGTVYIIPATAGVKHYNAKGADETNAFFPAPAKTMDVELPVFGAVRIDGDTLTYDAYTVNGTQTQLIDSFAIAKVAAAIPEVPQGGGQTQQPVPPEGNPDTRDPADLGAVIFLTVSAAAAVALCTRKKK